MTNPRIDLAGNKQWLNSKNERHRDDGPAIEWIDGTKQWWINGQLHREDGPAIEWAGGKKEWYIKNKGIQ